MAVYIDSIAFSNEFATNDTDWLLGVVNERLIVTIDVSVREVALPPDADSEFEFFPATGYINAQQVIKAQTGVFKNFQTGDVINITNAGANNRTGAVITEKISDSEIRTGETFVNLLSSTATVIYATDITAMNFYYGLIENSEAFNTLSKLTNTNQKYFASSLDPTDLVTVTTMTAEGSKAWQNGSVTIVGLGVDTYNQKFRIVHTFDILPAYNADEESNFNNGIKSTYFQDTKCLKYVTLFEALEDITNPNQKQSGINEGTLGNTGEYNENFNNVPTKFTPTEPTYTNSLLEEQNTIHITTDEQNVEFFINSSESSFSNNNTKVLLLFSLLPSKEEYNITTRNVKENFLFDRKLQTVGSAAANGDNYGTNQQVIYQYSSTFISATQIRVNFKVKFLSAGIDYINTLTDKKFLISAITQNHALQTEISDKTNILVAKDELFLDLSDDGLITFSSDLIEHDDITLIGSVPEIFHGDEVIHRTILTYDTLTRDISKINFKTLKVSVVAYKNETSNFELISKEVDLLDQIYSEYIPQINISTEINDPVFSDINRSNLIMKRRADLDSTSNPVFTNLILNPNFDLDLSSWQNSNGTFSAPWFWNSGAARINGYAGIIQNQLFQSISGLTIGEDYRVTFSVTAFNKPNPLTSYTVSFLGTSMAITGVGTITFDVLNWNGVDNKLKFIVTLFSSPSFLEIDNVSVIDINEITSSEVTKYAYEVSYPFLLRWEYWEVLLGVNSDFFDITEPNNGQNHLWYHYQSLGYTVRSRIELIVNNDGYEQTYQTEKILQLNDYDSNTNWINEYIKTFDGVTELTSGSNKYLLNYRDVRIEAYFENTGSITPANISVVIWAEIFEAGGITGREGISSLYDVESDSWFYSVDTSNKVKLTIVGSTVKAEAMIKSSSLPNGGNIRIYARLYDKTGAAGEGLQLEDSGFILLEDGDNILLEG